ncbi:MAG TPA: thioredoxin family protein [Thermoanaerobaculia bacterium]|nr:thioredoxin family protein [Thermoanaerobaculia bacterium]
MNLRLDPPRRATRRALAASAAVLCLLVGLPAAAALDVPQRAELAVHLDRSAYAPGEEARLAAVLEIDRGWHVNAHQPTYEYLIPTELTLTLPDGWGEPELTYPEAVRRAFSFAADPLDVYEGRAMLLATVTVPAAAAAGSVPVLAAVRYQACDDRSCLPPVTVERELELVVGPGGEAVNAAVFADGGEGATEAAGAAGFPGVGRLALMLLLGVVGGLILNVMPCVLPVLSLKVFGLVKAAGVGRREVVVGSLATTAGILASFWALALFAVGARAAGAAVGWGVQFQQPGFVTFLAVVVVLFCLNLWGLFEIPLPGRLATLGGGGAGGDQGLAGHFGSGLFATLMATPCSAPFLGTAVGFALAQSWPVILAIFTAVGLGMALPYLALAVAPGAARLLPKPGAWMETLKKVMGFFLAAAAVWLLYVLAGQVSPERLAAIELGLLALALFVWARSRVTRRGVLRHATAAGVVGAAALAMVLAVGAGTVARASVNAKLVPWVEFDRGAAEQMAADGQLVFVDVTADWCFTCKTNERLVLETADTAALFEEHGVVPMKADWTNRDDAIAAFLADHGRYSIPFYLLYRPGAEPHVFSELLTKGDVREAVERAAAGLGS